MWSLLFTLAMFSSESIDLSGLTVEQRKTFDRVAEEEFCGCNSSLTLAGCIATRPQCGFAKEVGTILARAVEQGHNANTLLNMFAGNTLGSFCNKPLNLALAGAPSLGSNKAPITLVEFADFRCPHCKMMAPVVRDAIQKAGKRVYFVFLPFPLRDHPLSLQAAEAAYAAFAQGKFPQFSEALFATHDELEIEVILAVAKQVGLDMKTFQNDLSGQKYRQAVTDAKQLALKAGIESTPSFFVNGRPFEPQESFAFADRFSLELSRAGKNCD